MQVLLLLVHNLSIHLSNALCFILGEQGLSPAVKCLLQHASLGLVLIGTPCLSSCGGAEGAQPLPGGAQHLADSSSMKWHLRVLHSWQEALRTLQDQTPKAPW